MKKPILLLTIIAWSCIINAQSGLSYDQEFVPICLVDSISPSNQVNFSRIYNVATKSYQNKTENGTADYTPTGTVIPCFNLVGYSECRLRSVSNSSTKRKWSLDNSDVSTYHDDIFLVGILYEEFLGEGVGPGKKNIVIPLNYPYGNTTSEATRFVHDIKTWMECKSIHYIDSSTWASPSTYALQFQIHTVRNNFDINTDLAYYSINLKDPTPTFIIKSGSSSTVSGISTFEVCEVYRKEKNGAVYYIMPYYNTTPMYPNDASFGLLGRRVDCNYQSNRGGDCDRPATQNCYLCKSDSMLTTYYMYISTKDTIQTVYARGTSIPLGGNFYATVQPDQKQLQDTLQKWLTANNYYGRVSVENSKHNASDGWVITITYTDCVFDSIATNRHKYYFEIVDSKDYLYFDVSRNELGGIISCIDQYGRHTMCPPEAANMVPCSQVSEIGGCIYKGKFGSTVITSSGTTNFDLSSYSSFQIYQTSGTGSLVTPKYPSGTSTITLSGGMLFNIKSEKKCKYLAKQTLSYTWTSGTAIASYTW
jgi:hypothetical protein